MCVDQRPSSGTVCPSCFWEKVNWHGTQQIRVMFDAHRFWALDISVCFSPVLGYKNVPPCSTFYGGSMDQTQVLLFAQPAFTSWMIFPAPSCFYEPQDSHSPQSQSWAPADGIEDGVESFIKYLEEDFPPIWRRTFPLSLLFTKFE